jgi:hypothetical protein
VVTRALYGGLILADVFKNDAAAFYSGIPLRNWLSNNTPDVYRKAIQDPQDVGEWMWVRKEDDLDREFISREKLIFFEVAYRDENLRIYKRRNGVEHSAK